MQAVAERLDHLGLIAGTIKELGLVELINERLGTDTRECITIGESVAAMIINGLGFSSKPLSLTPRFFANKAVSSLFREGVEAEHFNANKLSRSLDELHEYGLETLFAEAAAKVCIQAKVNTDTVSLDTTSISVDGEYHADSDENTIHITYGHSKDKRSDLKQAVHELLVSQDGGVPLLMKTCDGNASDSTIFRSRVEDLIKMVKGSKWKGILVADSKLYDRKTAEHLKLLTFVTRIPSMIKEEKKCIQEALEQNTWISIDDTNKYYTIQLMHYGIQQRWVVVYSDPAKIRAEKRIKKLIEKEADKIAKFQKKFQASEFGCEMDANNAVKEWRGTLVYHDVKDVLISKKPVFSGKGRPKKDLKPDSYRYNLELSYGVNETRKTEDIAQGSCYVVGSNAGADVTDLELVQTYKKQNSSVENMGFRFIKDPLFFTSSLFVKKPERIQGLLFIMSLSLLVYSIAQRKLRQMLEEQNECIPNQINQPTKKPTLRWVFQLFEGIDIIHVTIDGVVKKIISGINTLTQKIIGYFGPAIGAIYTLSP